MDADDAFKSKRVAGASPSDWARWLHAMSMQRNERADLVTREIVRAITLNNMQSSRTINDLECTIRNLNTSNAHNASTVKRFTIVCAVCAIIQIPIAVGVLWLMLRPPTKDDRPNTRSDNEIHAPAKTHDEHGPVVPEPVPAHPK